jgi:polygalacturonase
MSLTKVSFSMITGEVINVLDYGATGDGTTDDTTAIQAAIVAAANKTLYFPAGIYLFTGLLTIDNSMTICGENNSTQLKPSNGSGNTLRVNASYVTIKNLRIVGATPGVIAVGYSGLVYFTTIENIYFSPSGVPTLGQCVWIWTAKYVNINNCTFNGTGYGIIQQNGYASSYVSISNCFATNMTLDFVEANCAATAPSEFWSITGCQYTDGAGFPTAQTEARFVGITSVKNVIIANNIIQKVCGDAAIHLEDTLGQTIISNNIFDNVVCSGGNDGYIYILNVAENTTVTGNIFLRTDASLPQAYCLSTTSNQYNINLVFANNRIEGLGNLSGLHFFTNQGTISVNGNVAYNLVYFLNGGGVFPNNISITNNNVNIAEYGIICDGTLTTTGGGGENILIEGNLFTAITTYDVALGQNTNGTSPVKKLTLTSNVFAKNVFIRDSSGANQCEDVTITNNVFKASATLTGLGFTIRKVLFANIFNDYGFAVSTLNDYANDAAAAAAGVPIGGMYRNASVVQIRVT